MMFLEIKIGYKFVLVRGIFLILVFGSRFRWLQISRDQACRLNHFLCQLLVETNIAALRIFNGKNFSAGKTLLTERKGSRTFCFF